MDIDNDPLVKILVLNKDPELIQNQADYIERVFTGRTTEWDFCTSGWRKYIGISKSGKAELYNHYPSYKDEDIPTYRAADFIFQMEIAGMTKEQALENIKPIDNYKNWHKNMCEFRGNGLPEEDNAEKLSKQTDIDRYYLQQAELKRKRKAEKRKVKLW